LGPCIIIEAEEGDVSEKFMTPMDPFTCNREDAITRIREAGILGMGGAGFPTHIKLSPPPNKPIDLIIANNAECEPYLTTDEAAITDTPHLLIKGLEIAMNIAGVKKAIIGMEDNKKELIPGIEQAIRLHGINSDISIGLCRTRYPQGGEKIMVTTLTGREVPSGGLPMNVGCIVLNVASLISIAEAFTLGKPLIDRIFTVSGGACKTPKNIRAPIGTMIHNLPKEFLDIDYSRLAKIVFGGPMMGYTVASLDIPVQKNTSGIILMTQEETTAEEESPCICCARCTHKCPLRLSPVMMNNSLNADDLDYAVKAGLLDCMECGSCAYICPARIKLVQRFRVGKQKWRSK
jgi:electron transport complex protein RnfC